MRIIQDVRHGVSVQLSAAEVAELVQGLVARDCMEDLSAAFGSAGVVLEKMSARAEEVEMREVLRRELMLYAALSRMERREAGWWERGWSAVKQGRGGVTPHRYNEEHDADLRTG